MRRITLIVCALAACVPAPQEDPVLIVIAGQSNAVGGVEVTEITDPAVEAELSLPYAPVQLAWKLAGSATDPIPWTERGFEALAPRGAIPKMGVELTLGRTLGSISHIYKFAISGSNLHSDWNPDGTYPTQPPGEPNVYSQFVTGVQEQLATSGARLGAIVWIQANGDCTTVENASAYQANLTAFEARLRADLGDDWVFIFDRAHTTFGAFAATVRAGQAAFAASTRLAVMVDTDDLAMRDDDHYSADGLVELGKRFGYALVPYIAGGYLMAGTTFEDIRDKQLDLLRVLLPTEVPSQPFRAWEANESDFAAWADAGGGPFRTVEIEHGFDYPDEKYLDAETGSVVHTERVLVSYPNVRELAGRLLDYIIDRDIIDIQTALGQRGYGSYADLGAGEHVAQLTGVEVERRRAARVLRLTFQLSYDRAI